MHNAIYKFQAGIPREQGERPPAKLLRGHRSANKKQGGIFFFFLVGLEESFCFAFVQVSMETPLLELCGSSQPLSRMQGRRQGDKPEVVFYFSAAMS